MAGRILVATTAPGIARAVEGHAGSWSVERLLPDVRVTCLVRPSPETAVLLAGTRDDGVLRSDDLGRTWRPHGLAGVMVRSLAASTADPGTVYVGTKPAALFVTRDGGATWSELEGFRRARRWHWRSPAEPPDFRAQVLGLAVSPTDPDVLLAGIEAGAVVRSADGGRTWSAHRRRADRDCHDLRFHATDGAWAYQAGGGGPAVSRDGGLSWRHSTRGMQGRYCMACAAHPSRPEVWYVSASPMFALPPRGIPQAHVPGDSRAGIYRMSGGAAWERLGGGLPQPIDHMPYALVTDILAPDHVYAGNADGSVWHSEDCGESWQPLPLELGCVFRSMLLLS